jgi:hypothetical protein
MTDIQHEQHHTGSFPESRPISYIFFSSKTILWSPNLEELYMQDNDSIEVVFDLEGLMVDNHHQRIPVLAQLKSLNLGYLMKLTYIWKNVPRGIQGFQNLTSIHIRWCPNLRYLFPLSIAKLLVELQSVSLEYPNNLDNYFYYFHSLKVLDLFVGYLEG